MSSAAKRMLKSSSSVQLVLLIINAGRELLGTISFVFEFRDEMIVCSSLSWSAKIGYSNFNLWIMLCFSTNSTFLKCFGGLSYKTVALFWDIYIKTVMKCRLLISKHNLFEKRSRVYSLNCPLQSQVFLHCLAHTKVVMSSSTEISFNPIANPDQRMSNLHSQWKYTVTIIVPVDHQLWSAHQRVKPGHKQGGNTWWVLDRKKWSF